MATRPNAPGLVSQNSPSVIHVADGLDGDGTRDRPWELTPKKMIDAVRLLSWTRKTIFFRAGEYVCREPIEINFATLFPHALGDDSHAPLESDANFLMLREGVRFIGEGRGSVLTFTGAQCGMAQLHIHWSVSTAGQDAATAPALPEGAAVKQAPLFFWEFTGLNVKGSTPSVLVQFGGKTVEDTAWNSCVFDIAVNNGYQLPAALLESSETATPHLSPQGGAMSGGLGSSLPTEVPGMPPLSCAEQQHDGNGGGGVGGASFSSNGGGVLSGGEHLGDVVSPATRARAGDSRGIVLKRVLQSRVELVAACHTGVACVLDTCEFNTFNGSFSNGEVEDANATRGVSISPHGVALYLLHCVANGSASVNIEVAFTGIKFVGSTRGNAFGSIVSNNCDARGHLFDDDEVAQGARNVVQCAVRRDVRQQEGVWQPLFTPRTQGSVTVLNTLN